MRVIYHNWSAMKQVRWENTCRWPIVSVVSVPKTFVNGQFKFNLLSKMWSRFFGTQCTGIRIVLWTTSFTAMLWNTLRWDVNWPPASTFLACRINGCSERLYLLHWCRFLQLIQLLLNFSTHAVTNSTVRWFMEMVDTCCQTALGCYKTCCLPTQILHHAVTHSYIPQNTLICFITGCLISALTVKKC